MINVILIYSLEDLTIMDLTALPTQLSNNTDTHIQSVNDTATNNDMDKQMLGANNLAVTDPNAIILAQALTDKAISWRIHNCKISQKTVTQDLPLPFLYHYDSLDESIKANYPLIPSLLAQFNTPMCAHDAAKLIGIDEALLSTPWHIKVVGSLVVFSEALQLAVRLHWTNTGKKTQQIYTQDKDDAILAAFKDWQFFGRIDILYKNNNQSLISVDEQSIDTETNKPLPLMIEANTEYQYLPATHALVVIAKLEADKGELPWFETAILERIA
ncbi:hypothetical protein Psyc_1303 [Psychrobacter arcticus 273-4]|uniref:Uncharacterized protein n=1 Tax=Psychrobacter arcticus (strain DSM 17307 / VKM B-2377 / 273-4) TaxID=259536 RepID=Q4FS55_PSYA2|nr:hypothetical protein [Psychrobacter arcticus]AAZ19153.1 hypothetical protein Psyc_1303 [Psychrobacter arcticus 273-4]